MLNFEIKLNQNEKMLLQKIVSELVNTPHERCENEDDDSMVCPNHRHAVNFDLSIPEESDLKTLYKKLNFGRM